MKRSQHSTGRSPARRVHIPRTVVGLAAAAMVVPFLATVAPQVSAAPGDEKVQLLSFNDYHGHVEDDTAGSIDGSFGGPAAGGGEYLSAKLTELRAAGATAGVPAGNSFTVAAGDNIGGSPFFSGLFHDEPSVESLNEMGLDYSGVGNHEFDEGTDELIRMQAGGCHPVDGCYFTDYDPSTPGDQEYGGADFDWLAANVTEDAPDGTNDFEDTIEDWSIATTAGGKKIGIIGMTLEGTDKLVAAAGIAGFTFEDEITAGNQAVADIKATDATVEAFVVLLHEGGIPSPFAINGCAGISGPIIAIAEGLSSEIDAIITGHTHQPYTCSIDDPADNPRPVTSAFSYGRVVTEINLELDPTTGEVDRDTFTMVNHEVLQSELTADPDVTAIINKWKPLAEDVGNTPVGSITATVTRGGDPTGSDRGVESAAGNLVADAQLASTQSLTPPAQVAFMNPGGLRSDLVFEGSSAGEGDGVVTYGEAFTFQPFNNTMFVLPMTGEQIVNVLEEQCQPGDSSRPFLHLGVSNGFTYDLANTIEGGVCTAIEITNVELNGVALNPAATYQVAVNNFLADGGDNFDTFAEVAPADRAPGPQDIDALTGYLGANSPVAPPGTDRVDETRTSIPAAVESFVPARLLDTRVGPLFKTIDGEFEGGGAEDAGGTIELDVAGRGDIADDASAVIMNIGVIRPSARGFLTVYPCDQERPVASNVNYPQDGVVSNSVLAQIDGDGKVCIYTSAPADLYADANAAVPAGGSPTPLLPARLLETRVGPIFTTVDGDFEGDGPIAAGGRVVLEVAGRGGVPADASAAVLNVGVVRPAEQGFLTIYPCDEERPLASNVNYGPDTTVSNGVNALISAEGEVCVYSSKEANVIVDVNASIPEDGSPKPLVPTRLLETRQGPDDKTIDGNFEGRGRVPAGFTVQLEVAGRGGIPEDATSAVLNVGAVRPDGAGFITVYPCGEDRPLASSVNYRGDDVISNSVTAQIGADGKVCIYTLRATDLIADATGFVEPVMPFRPES